MRCPFCGAEDTQVRDSRPAEEQSAIRRRRICTQCDARFTTFERVQLRDLIVLKKNGEKVLFDRDKLARSLRTALRKRPIESDTIEKTVSQIVRSLESRGEGEITSEDIGNKVMEVLYNLDQVAYVRYASVYRNFDEAKDFQNFIGTLGKNYTPKS